MLVRALGSALTPASTHDSLIPSWLILCCWQLFALFLAFVLRHRVRFQRERVDLRHQAFLLQTVVDQTVSLQQGHPVKGRTRHHENLQFGAAVAETVGIVQHFHDVRCGLNAGENLYIITNDDIKLGGWEQRVTKLGEKRASRLTNKKAHQLYRIFSSSAGRCVMILPPHVRILPAAPPHLLGFCCGGLRAVTTDLFSDFLSYWCRHTWLMLVKFSSASYKYGMIRTQRWRAKYLVPFE